MLQNKIRQSNFELLRIVCILLILSMHCASQSTITSMDSPNEWMAHLINSVGNIGVTCFILISGYFGVRFKADRLVQLILLTTFYSIIVYLFNNNFHCDISIIKSALVVPLYTNWFITCYMLLMLFSPFLNKLCESMNRAAFRNLVLLGFLVFSILPTVFNTPYYTVIYGGGKCLTYMVFLYFVGRYIRIYNNKKYTCRKALCSFFLLQVLINVINMSLEHILHKPCHIWSMDCSPLILGSAIAVFFIFQELTFQSRIINWLSSSVLAVFLLDALRIWVNGFLHVEQYSNEPYFILLLLCLIFSTFALATAIDKVRILVLGRVEQKCVNVVIEAFELLMRNLRPVISKL